jgi:hypothetical protein
MLDPVGDEMKLQKVCEAVVLLVVFVRAIRVKPQTRLHPVRGESPPSSARR